MIKLISMFPGIELECECGKKRVVPDTFTKKELREAAMNQIIVWVGKLKFTSISEKKDGGILFFNKDSTKKIQQWERDQERTLVISISIWLEFYEIKFEELRYFGIFIQL